jgi:hypothetical protein
VLREIPPEEGKHDCRNALPWSGGGYGSTGRDEGTLACCPTCGRWWRCAPCYASLGPVTWWLPVRWWHRRLRRRIAEAEAGPC